MPLIVGQDLDGCVVDFQFTWAQLYDDYFDTSLVKDHWSGLLHLNQYDAILNLTHFESYGEFFAWFYKAGGWKMQPYIVGARGGVDSLKLLGHRVKFITNRPAEAEPGTWEWLARSPWPGMELFVRADKWNVRADVYVDDTPKMIEQLADNGKKVIIFDQPWNQDVETDDEQIVRAKSWQEVVTLVALLEEYKTWSLEAIDAH